MTFLPLLALVAFGSSRGGEFDQSHKLWTEVLSAHVRGDGLDYKKLKDDRVKLDAYIGSLETVMPEEFAGWKREQQFAYWIDAYNAYTIRRVLDAYPIASIQDLADGKTAVWDQEFIPLGRLFPEAGEKKLTLNDVENRILRPKFKDARVHVALNCASRGCPPIFAEALVAERLDKQLDALVARWLADPERNRFDKKSAKIVVSKVFDWFKDDFVRDAGSVQAWIAARAPESERAWLSSADDLKIEFLAYSWKLNEAR
jgi:uncharacterized protein DUF547